MLEIQLTEEEHRVLQSAIEIYLRELRGEIADTDARRLRDALKGEERTLRSILQRLGEAPEKPR